MNWLSGKKTYIMAALLFIYAMAGLFTGHLDFNTAVGLVWGSGTVAALRSAIAK